MPLKLELSDAARADVFTAAQYYESEKPGLGDAFAREVRRALAIALSYPDAGSAFHRSCRTVRTRRFPYNVIYADPSESGVLVVVAVLHDRENRKRIVQLRLS